MQEFNIHNERPFLITIFYQRGLSSHLAVQVKVSQRYLRNALEISVLLEIN